EHQRPRREALGLHVEKRPAGGHAALRARRDEDAVLERPAFEGVADLCDCAGGAVEVVARREAFGRYERDALDRGTERPRQAYFPEHAMSTHAAVGRRIVL